MKIVVLAGGISTERDVSLVTGSMIYKALVNKGHEVVLLDVYLGYEEDNYSDIFSIKRDWSEKIGTISSQNPDISQVKALRKDNPECAIGPHVIDICSQADIVFLALHGQNGEDGKIQAMFDLLDIKYTGTNYLSSALAMDKAISKEFFVKYGIPTPEGITLEKGQQIKWNNYPCIVKVNCGGSSVGVYKANDEKELTDALKEAFSFEDIVLIEEFIEDNDNTQSFVLAGDSLFMYNVTFSKSNVDNIPLMFNKYIELKKCNFIDIEQKSSIILSNADSASVDSCVFRGCKGNGLLSESKSIQVSNSIFESNEVYDVFFATVDCDAYLYRNTFSNNITSSSVGIDSTSDLIIAQASSIKSIALSGKNLSVIYLTDNSTADFIDSSVILTLW